MHLRGFLSILPDKFHSSVASTPVKCDNNTVFFSYGSTVKQISKWKIIYLMLTLVGRTSAWSFWLVHLTRFYRSQNENNLRKPFQFVILSLILFSLFVSLSPSLFLKLKLRKQQRKRPKQKNRAPRSPQRSQSPRNPPKNPNHPNQQRSPRHPNPPRSQRQRPPRCHTPSPPL